MQQIKINKNFDIQNECKHSFEKRTINNTNKKKTKLSSNEPSNPIIKIRIPIGIVGNLVGNIVEKIGCSVAANEKTNKKKEKTFHEFFRPPASLTIGITIVFYDASIDRIIFTREGAQFRALFSLNS